MTKNERIFNFRVTRSILVRLGCIALLAGTLSFGGDPVGATGTGDVHVDATVHYPQFPCLANPEGQCSGGTISGMATGFLAGMKDGQLWNVSFSDAQLLANFDYVEQDVGGILPCEGEHAATGTGTLEGSAIGEINGDEVTGLSMDFVFEWKRSAVPVVPYGLTDGRLSRFDITILASVTLLPQNVVVFSPVQLIPNETAPSNGVLMGISSNLFGGACDDEPDSLDFAVMGELVPVDPDPLACLRSFGDPEYPIEVQCLPFAPENANLVVKSDPNEEELGDEYYWHCDVKPNAFPTSTTNENNTTSYGWRATGRVWCDETVPELGVTVQWDEEGANDDTGICAGSQLVHDLANEPHQVEDSLHEVTQAAEDTDKAKCVVYYKRSDWVCTGYCETITVFDIRFTIVFPKEVTKVDHSSMTVTAEPTEGQTDYCYKSPNDRFSVECHFQKIDLVRAD